MFFEQDRASFEEYVCFYFCAFLEESDGVFEFEVVVVVVGLGSEPDFFDDDFGCFCFYFFCFLFLLVEEFLVIEDFADWRFGLSGYFDEVEFEFFGDFASLLDGVYSGCHVVANEPDFASTDVFVDVVRGLFGLAWVAPLLVLLRWARGCGTWSGGMELRFFLH